ncbi:MAG: hypothetical protein ACRCX2_03150 [Paraclostridium sp.]
MKIKEALLCGITIALLGFNASIQIPTYANEVLNDVDSNLSPRYKYIKYAKSDLEIKNGVAIIKSNMTSSTSTTKSLITSRLQRKVNGTWTTVEAWTVSNNSISCSLEKSKSIVKGNEYRVFSTVKAYTASDSESIAVFSPIKKY